MLDNHDNLQGYQPQDISIQMMIIIILVQHWWKYNKTEYYLETQTPQ